MSHVKEINLVSDQTILAFGEEINMHDIVTIVLDPNGKIKEYIIHKESGDGKPWISIKEQEKE